MGALKVLFLEDGAQTAESVAQWLADIVAQAQVSLDLAVYDCHLKGPSADLLVGALQERQRAGVALRILYNEARAPTSHGGTVDLASPDLTAAFFADQHLAALPVNDGHGGAHLMHHKYLLVDAGTPDARLWTGSANLTTAAFTRQENNLLSIASPKLVQAYAADFEQLWKTRSLEGSGASVGATVRVDHDGERATIEVRFAPGDGAAIDEEVARRIRGAQREVTVASVVISSAHILGALADLASRGVPLSGIVDLTSMEEIVGRWRYGSASAWKAHTFAALVSYGQLHGKRSAHYSPAGPHDYMHNKVIVVDDTVITGSYNYSANAEGNAENILFIESPSLARAYRAYVGRLVLRYPPV
jgi:phosphatidylserine/phosphatidylglycerophosphate/cardiolipin synthase-like enzyme